MIRVYKTTVESKTDVRSITDQILRKIPSCDISFDLEDCDNVLRIESFNGDFDEEVIRQIFQRNEHELESLPF